ncbi:unnamed protein product [Spirodela intermedia]|uniref:Uncharacterized protein n=1 Tax=Spirodela intermedia TaxID=51605 RepID=A0A7I8L0L8_SPIIN|nr:unnamed protein product [Spirodela intermedia]
MTASTSMVRPSTRSTLPRENLLTPGTTLMSPDLIFPRAPMSRTGVFPSLFFSSMGPSEGRRMPYLSRLPKTSHANISKILSTIQSGSHFIRVTAISNSRTTMKGKAS